jgi:hypothetical protein
MTKIKDLIPPFNSDRQVKSAIAVTMWTDSNDFLLRSNIILQNLEFSSFAYLSKIYIDILMAIESDLKCIIISLSNKSETPEEAYGIARKCNHRIDKLYNEVRKRAFRKVKLLNQRDEDELLKNAIKIRVENRYRLVTLMKLRKDGKFNIDWGLGEYSQLLEYNYILKLQKIAFQLHQISQNASDKYLDRSGMLGTNLGKFDKRLEEFFKTVNIS